MQNSATLILHPYAVMVAIMVVVTVAAMAALFNDVKILSF
jgi:hypothetical protein